MFPASASPRRTSWWPAQAALALIVVALVALVPPVRGPMLLLPVTGAAADRLAARAVEAGARLIGPGPTAGSLIVEATRARMTGIVSRGVLIVAAPSGWCGVAERTGRLA